MKRVVITSAQDQKSRQIISFPIRRQVIHMITVLDALKIRSKCKNKMLDGILLRYSLAKIINLIKKLLKSIIIIVH